MRDIKAIINAKSDDLSGDSRNKNWIYVVIVFCLYLFSTV